MTGPSFPFFQPNVTPSYTFQDPGDVGAVGGELHGLAKAFGEMQAREQLAQAQQAEHEMSMQGLALRQMQEESEQIRLKIAKKEADDKAAEAKHRRDLEIGKTEAKKTAGAGVKSQVAGSVGGVADAGLTEAEAAKTGGQAGAGEIPGGDIGALTGLLAGLFGQDFGGQGTGVSDEGVEDYLKQAKDAQALQETKRDPNLASPDAILSNTRQSQEGALNRSNAITLQKMKDAAALERAKLPPKTGAGAGSNRQIQQAAAALPMMKQASTILDGLETGVDPSSMVTLNRLLGDGGAIKGGFATAVNGLTNVKDQLALNQARLFASNWLRFVSGLTVTDKERIDVINQVAPMQGDSPEILLLKGATRENMVKTIENAASGATGETASAAMEDMDIIMKARLLPNAKDDRNMARAKANLLDVWTKSHQKAQQYEKFQRDNATTLEATGVAIDPEDEDVDPNAVDMMQTFVPPAANRRR